MTDAQPVVFCLHFLAGSKRSWNEVANRLHTLARVVALDLPGFGEAADHTGYTVTDMADAVAAAIREVKPTRWLLAGHSMGAKVAMVVARRAEDGEPGLAGLAGIALLTGSPPGPEPMEDDRRQTMLGWFAGDAGDSRRQATTYIDGAIGKSLDPAKKEQAVEDVLRANPAAWRAWLAQGSREDWGARIGTLATPAVIIAGGDDAELGPSAQHRLVKPHFSHARLVVLEDAGHLLPMERPGEVSNLLAELLPGPSVPYAYRALINSGRVSEHTRELLLDRALPDHPAYQPATLNPSELAILRAVMSRVLPQKGPAIDLAARIDARLAGDQGDGWRFAALPSDPNAYRAGLRTLDVAAGRAFCSLDPAQQDALLHRAANAHLGAKGPGLLEPAQMKLWFEDIRADAVRTYVAHPATLARMGYSGIGYGGDGEPKSGFHQVGIGEREAWEPEPQA